MPSISINWLKKAGVKQDFSQRLYYKLCLWLLQDKVLSGNHY